MFEFCGCRAAVQFIDGKAAMILLWRLEGAIAEADLARILEVAACEPLKWLARDVWRSRDGASAVLVSSGTLRLQSQSFCK
jgi:hypothetical protein